MVVSNVWQGSIVKISWNFDKIWWVKSKNFRKSEHALMEVLREWRRKKERRIWQKVWEENNIERKIKLERN